MAPLRMRSNPRPSIEAPGGDRVESAAAKANCLDNGTHGFTSSCSLIGDSGRARTCDLPLRRRLLYPAELRSRIDSGCRPVHVTRQCDQGTMRLGAKLSE